jgi:hypothetical protein
MRDARDAVLSAYDSTLDRLSPRPFPNTRVFRRRLATYQPVHLVAVITKP